MPLMHVHTPACRLPAAGPSGPSLVPNEKHWHCRPFDPAQPPRVMMMRSCSSNPDSHMLLGAYLACIYLAGGSGVLPATVCVRHPPERVSCRVLSAEVPPVQAGGGRGGDGLADSGLAAPRLMLLEACSACTSWPVWQSRDGGRGREGRGDRGEHSFSASRGFSVPNAPPPPPPEHLPLCRALTLLCSQGGRPGAIRGHAVGHAHQAHGHADSTMRGEIPLGLSVFKGPARAPGPLQGRCFACFV